MENKGIVGPYQGSKPRAIKITRAQWEAMKNGGLSLDSADEGDDNSPVPEDF